MSKKIISILVLVAWAIVLPAQITREQADVLVKEHLQRENVESNLLYINTNAPSAEGVPITTSSEETFQAKYACWAYYLNESEVSQCRYLFVKEDNGNLLEVIASNDLGQSDLTQWKAVEGDSVGIVGTWHAASLRIYPNPVDDILTIPCPNERSLVEIYDVKGCRLFSETVSGKENAHQLNVSFLNTGTYIISVYGETKVIYKLIKK